MAFTESQKPFPFSSLEILESKTTAEAVDRRLPEEHKRYHPMDACRDLGEAFSGQGSGQ